MSPLEALQLQQYYAGKSIIDVEYKFISLLLPCSFVFPRFDSRFSPSRSSPHLYLYPINSACSLAMAGQTPANAKIDSQTFVVRSSLISYSCLNLINCF